MGKNQNKKNIIKSQSKELLSFFQTVFLKKFLQSYRRNIYFSSFQNVLRLDCESWFSVTPEFIAHHQAKRCCTITICDAFCGSGGNTVKLTFSSNLVLAFEQNECRLGMAR